MSELADLIAEQDSDRQNYRARDVFDPHAIQFLMTAPTGLPDYSCGPRLISIAHGTLYAYKRLLCRCAECRSANAAWQCGYRLSLLAAQPAQTAGQA